MERRDCDALVLFGATGDLCYRKIYPALYHLVRRGLLSVPIVGVSRNGSDLAWTAGRRPSLFAVVSEHLSATSSGQDPRLVVEKPFGRDLASARELNATLHEHFPESRIFRIDHYLGKEAVQNLQYFRFANSFLEPVWNRNYVASVQITMAETIGVAGRGRFYEEAGCIRDVIQNTLMQIVT